MAEKSTASALSKDEKIEIVKRNNVWTYNLNIDLDNVKNKQQLELLLHRLMLDVQYGINLGNSR